VIIDIPAQGGCATLVALTDNTTSLYTSTGGGTIGAGGHATVASATHALLASAERHLNLFSVGEDRTMPSPGVVRFHVLSVAEQRTEDVPEDSVWGRADHPLMPVIAAAQQVISSINQASPENT
jgi:hypothetical protein